MTGMNSALVTKQAPRYGIVEMILLFLFPFFGIEELNKYKRF